MNQRNVMPSDPTFEVTEERLYKPRLGHLLQSLRLDVAFEKGYGNYLSYTKKTGESVEVLDLVGGYGSLLLGHNHPKLVKAAQQFFGSHRPMLVQGSRSDGAKALAGVLSERVGGDYTSVFANSGAEAVEAAMKHAMLETGGHQFIALEGAFHGKTLGALQLTANPEYREPFASPGIDVFRVPVNDVDRLAQAFEDSDGLAGMIFEPVQGEGGIRLLSPEFAACAAKLCRQRRVPLIADECQTGCGRTGHFLGSHALGIQPDYVILSKSLGGGLAKISALMIEKARYNDRFDLMHSSTFAADGFSVAMAAESLKLIDEDLMQGCRRQGDRFLNGLRRLQSKYPRVIRSVRGVGLMVGVEFAPLRDSSSFLLRCMTDSQDLAFIVASYLFNMHHIRVAPSLSDRRTLRMTPPARITDEEIDRVLWALSASCQLLDSGDALGLTGHLSQSEERVSRPWVQGRADGRFCQYDALRCAPISSGFKPVARVAWLCHLIDEGGVVKLEPSFAGLEAEALTRYADRLGGLAAPILMSRVPIHSKAGVHVELHPILLPVTSRAMKAALQSGDCSGAQALVQEGVDMAHALGCNVVSLGQYTSIVTRNGRTIHARGMGLTTGNTYAVALGVQALLKSQERFGSRPGGATLAVVGASGNIGSACAERLAGCFSRVQLISNDTPRSIERTKKLAAQLGNATTSSNLDDVRDADAVVVAVNTVLPPLGSVHFKHGATICDLSVPMGVSADVQVERPDVLVFKGGIVQLGGREDLEIVGFPLETGLTYGCMAEGLLLGFEQMYDRRYTGFVRVAGVRELERLADRHGFLLADYKRSCVLGTAIEEGGVHAV